MNQPSVVVCLFMAGLSAKAAEIRPAIQRIVKVCELRGSGSSWVVTRAEATASRIFEEIGVGITWYQDHRTCGVPPKEFLVIEFSAYAPDSRFPGALAYSRLQEGVHIEVFYDRVVKAVDPRNVSILLGHVLAHEIGHMLEGITRHSREGIMKECFSERDLIEMGSHSLSFAAEDVDLIWHGLEARGSTTNSSILSVPIRSIQ